MKTEQIHHFKPEFDDNETVTIKLERYHSLLFGYQIYKNMTRDRIRNAFDSQLKESIKDGDFCILSNKGNETIHSLENKWDTLSDSQKRYMLRMVIDQIVKPPVEIE